MFYLRARKIDLSSNHKKTIIINHRKALEEAITTDTKLEISKPNSKKKFIVNVDITEKLVSHHEIGISNSLWEKINVHEGEIIEVNFLSQPKSILSIRKKLLGKELNYNEIKSILEDIVSGRLGTIEATYFAACGFNPGFNDKELYYLTKAMAYTGDVFKWPYEKVVDKHSIGGLAGKGITPILVSIISSLGLVIPNTSTRSITSPAGTTDVMEVLCNMVYSKEEIEDLIRRNNACIVWGGGLDLAPADEALIDIEKPLGIELYDKFIVSIMAKKVAIGLTHLVLDIPYGPDTKVHHSEDVHMIQKKFESIAEKFGIKIKVVTRHAIGPDGRGIGPVLEAIDLLKVLLQRDDRYLPLEDVSLMLAGELLELCGEAKPGKGYEKAKKELQSGRAYKTFQKIIAAQGGNPNVQPEDLRPGQYQCDITADHDGVVTDIENHLIKDLAHSLGAPNIKSAGIYLHKQVGETVSKGEKLFTIYSTSDKRVHLACEILKYKNIVIY